MSKSLSLTALIACSLLWGCSKDSTTIIQSENKIQKDKIDQIITAKDGEALLEPQLITGNFDSLIQLGKKPSAESVDYYTVKEVILPDQTKKIIISSLFLNISENSMQDFFKRSNNVSEIIILAEKIVIATELKFPGAKITIKADELSFALNGKIITTPKLNPQYPDYGANGETGKNAGDIILDVKKLNLGSDQIRFEMNGGKGQAAGLGKNGAAGVSISPLFGNVIKECITVITLCKDAEAGEVTNDPTTSCRGSERTPTNGQNAFSSGLPGQGGNAGTLYLSENFSVSSSIENVEGQIGESAAKVSGGFAGTPINAIIRTTTTRRSLGRCKGSSGGGKLISRNDVTINSDQNISTSNGVDFSPRTVTNTAKPGNISDLRNYTNSSSDLSATGDMKRIRLEYAKDLYRNNYFSESRKILNKIENANSSNLEEALIDDEVSLLLNQLNSNKDFYGMDLAMAPVISLEATMNIFKQNVRTSMNTISLVASTQKTIVSAKDKINNLVIQKNQVRNQMELAYKNHETAYLMIPTLEIKLVGLEHSKAELQESLQKVETQIIAEASRNIHSAEKKKKLLGGLKLIATLASVSPLGAPAAQVIGSTLNTIIDLSQKKDADWQDVLKEGYGAYSELKKVDWHASHDSWNNIYSSLDKEVFLSNNKIDKKRTQAYLDHLYKTTKPLTDEVKKYYDNIYSKKVPANEYEAEIERIKSIHPLFKELLAKLQDVQQKKNELEIILSQVNNSLVTSKSEIIRDFAMITSLETQEEEFVDGLNFSIEEVLTKMDKDARNRLLKYKGALIKAYQYRTLMPFPGDLDLENINRSITAFTNKGEKAPSVEDLINVYEEDIAVIGQSLFNYIQNGNFKEYENEYTIDLNEKELSALSSGKTIYLDLTKEMEIFSNKENVRIISIEMENFSTSTASKKNADFIVTHLGNSVLTKNGRDYYFSHINEASPAIWISRLDLNSNTPSLLKESSSTASLLMSIMGRDPQDGILLFNRVGAKGNFAMNLKNIVGSVLTQATIKINYTYSTH